MAQPKQARLPGQEDPEIEELVGAAEAYAEIRDKRMALTEKETASKGEVLQLMKKHHKTHYKHDGIEITVVDEEETVKVRVHKDGEDEG